MVNVGKKPIRRLGRRGIVGALLTALFAALLVGGVSQEAQAATHGPGVYVGSGGTYWLGAFQTNPGGVRAYCIEPGLNPPVGFTQSAGVITTSTTISYVAYYGSGVQIAAGTLTLSAATLGRINYLIRTWGQTSNNSTAAAVQWAIKRFTNPYHDTEVSTGRWISVPAGIITAGDSYYAQALLYNPASSSGTGSGTMVFDVDPLNNYLGTLKITALSPSTTTGTITLTNGIFASNGIDTLTGTFTNGDVLDVEGTPPDGDPDYKIKAVGIFDSPSGPAANLTLHTTTNGRQTVASSGGVGTGNFTVNAEDPVDRATVFAPVASTLVANKYVQAGDTFSDTLTFDVADVELAGPNPGDPTTTIHNPWHRFTNGNYVRVKATGTLYGPFTTAPTENATAPVGAPVAGTATVTTTKADGPTINYTATTASVAAATGYYTWVWRIDYAGQPVETPVFLPDNYSFVDRFGQVDETHVLPSEVIATTQVSASEIPLSGTISDTVSVKVAAGSSWLSDASGTLIPITFTGQAWLWPGPGAPVVSTSPPSGASLLGTVSVVATAAGDYLSPTVDAPSTGAGWVSWVWSINKADQPVAHRGAIAEWADKFGLPNETTRLLTPAVTTVAVDAVALGEPAHDTATVTGTLPAETASLSFAAYLQAATGPATCTTPVFDTSATPVPVNALGDYQSPETTFTTAGTYFWVETLRAHDGGIIHQGSCGAAGETTRVATVMVTTIAVGEAVTGGAVHDTAMVRGTPPAGTVMVFTAYLQHDDTALCTGANTAYVSPAMPVTGPGQYHSPETKFIKAGTYFWVETVMDSNGDELHSGLCGAANEISKVKLPLAYTGSTLSGGLLFGGAVLLMLLGAGALIVARRRAATA